MPKTTLSLGLVTYKRPELLARCLQSLEAQTCRPDSILVVDNDVGQSAAAVAARFSNLPLKYLVEPNRSTPVARNRVLEACRTDFLGFIDDDCVPDKQWVETARHQLPGLLTDVGFLAGQSCLLNTGSLIARSQALNMQHWLAANLQTGGRVGPGLLDTKNCLIRMAPVCHHQLRFDQRFGRYPISANEDIDFGYQLLRLGYTGLYVPYLRVYHQEADTLRKILVKGYYRGRSKCLLHQKWHLTEPSAHDINFRLLPHPLENLRRIGGKTKYVGKRIFTESLSGTTFPAKTVVILAQEIHNLAMMQGYHDQLGASRR